MLPQCEHVVCGSIPALLFISGNNQEFYVRFHNTVLYICTCLRGIPFTGLILKVTAPPVITSSTFARILLFFRAFHAWLVPAVHL